MNLMVGKIKREGIPTTIVTLVGKYTYIKRRYHVGTVSGSLVLQDKFLIPCIILPRDTKPILNLTLIMLSGVKILSPLNLQFRIEGDIDMYI